MTLVRLDTNFAATQSAAGLMSATDKAKLDGVEEGAQKNVVRGVKGNAESTYRVGNVSLGPANIGASPIGHDHSGTYLPLSGGGTVAGGDINIKTASANTTTKPSSHVWCNMLGFTDTGGRLMSFLQPDLDTDGKMTISFGVRRVNSGSNANNNFTMSIDTSGNRTYSVASAANFRSAIGAAASSDRRLKSDVSPLGDDAVEFVKNLEPVVYTINGERQVGLIAQDVHEADPWDTRMAFETEDGIDGLDDWEKMEDGSPTWKLDYVRLIAPLTAALKDAMARIDELEERVSELEERLGE